MLRPYTAIVHLHEAHALRAADLLEGLDALVHGIGDVTVEPHDALVTVRFDRHHTGLAEIVRYLEECGAVVLGVAQRPLPQEAVL